MRDSHDAVQYEARLSDLRPDTMYDEVVGLGDRCGVPTNAFRTWPRSGTDCPRRLWVLGCSGTGAPHACAVHEGVQSSMKSSGRRFDLMLHMGDMASSRGRALDPRWGRSFRLWFESFSSRPR